ncbi:DUF523 domain-containing protein [Komagataeibacter xylinus]|uniref:DUF523 domain-containing protein n=1 Tax=Komagataeibacter xylinus TaxID=28448 RepID=A0A318PP94_KOMXY|nr:DUF523 domain-containing protein [Komagataeibacter xylinus]AZV37858.1 DUF523 domain-containing protein [Komagataeibacter xylinus]PYD56890.1 DUF523 domain-containing protein [Komagataeibacter xylinus]GBQ70196.1 hypothetical protein AA15237_0811 [Komagataeibacter xylinus NBRC 15237]
MKPNLLISGCLAGLPVRYDGSARPLMEHGLARWRAEGRVIVCCPETQAGLTTPRAPAEIVQGRDGAAVLDGLGQVHEATGQDVSAAFVAGAHLALALARKHHCALALLMDGSPSCGSSFIYDGTFSGTRHAGTGVTAALLRQHGVSVYAPAQFALVAARMDCVLS